MKRSRIWWTFWQIWPEQWLKKTLFFQNLYSLTVLIAGPSWYQTISVPYGSYFRKKAQPRLVVFFKRFHCAHLHNFCQWYRLLGMNTIIPTLMRCHKILSLKRKAEVMKTFSSESLAVTLTRVQHYQVSLSKDIDDLTDVKRTYLSKVQSMPAGFSRSRQRSIKKYNSSLLGIYIFSSSNIILDIILWQTSLRPTKED